MPAHRTEDPDLDSLGPAIAGRIDRKAVQEEPCPNIVQIPPAGKQACSGPRRRSQKSWIIYPPRNIGIGVEEWIGSIRPIFH